MMILAVCMMASALTAQKYDFQNTKLKDDQRVELFLKQLTLLFGVGFLLFYGLSLGLVPAYIWQSLPNS